MLLENREIKNIREIIRRSFNENSVSHSVFLRIFSINKVNIYKTLKKH